jgi:cysteine-rich repeat protein
MVKLTMNIIPFALAALAVLGCASQEAPVAGQAGTGAVASSVAALTGPDNGCGNGVVEQGEACDDGNQLDADGCSAQCQLDNVSSTPGDDRAGYVGCGRSAPELTCGPDQGCCAQPNAAGPACATERSECGQNPTFQACDGPEDCKEGVHCVGTRFGNACASNGYYWLCHTNADCEPSRPACDDTGVCRAAATCGDGTLEADEECDDSNTEDGDGCSARCKHEDLTTTPGDDRAGYVACGQQRDACGANQGCCTAGQDSEGNPTAYTCAATLDDCPSAGSFQACDGPEDCEAGVACMGTRFGNICGTGYSRVCHSDADCESDRPSCSAKGSCES